MPEEQHDDGNAGREDVGSPGQELWTKLALRLQADNLPRHGVRMSLPDTYAVVTAVSGRASNSGPMLTDLKHSSVGVEHLLQKTEWVRTEVVYKNNRPQWTTVCPLKYELGSECYFFVKIFRLKSQQKVQDEDLHQGEPVGESLGAAVFEVGDILGSKNNTKIRRLPKGGVVFCRLERIQDFDQNRVFRFQFAASNLLLGRGRSKRLSPLSPFASAPDTILQISKRHQCAMNQSWVAIYRSSPAENSFNPTWDIGEVVCNGDWDRPLRLAVLLHNKTTQDALIGQCETTLRMILNTQRDDNTTRTEEEVSRTGFPLQRSMSKPEPVGRLLVKLAQVMELSPDDGDGSFIGTSFSPQSSLSDITTFVNGQAMEDPYTVDIAALPTPMVAPDTFQDYIKGGWKLDFYAAIDFTSSNGDPRVPGTLHDQNPITLNDYEETLLSIGNALTPYTAGGELNTTVWGFGCKFDGTVRHIFQCGPDATVSGVDGIAKAYKSVFETDLTMSGPTCFDEVVQAAAVQALKHKQENEPRYSVLLVITDGICQDFQEIKRKLAVYSGVPLSIIFVGVGRSDFKAMYQLVGSTADGKTTRENVTFCEFRQHQHNPSSLGTSALQHLPLQFVQYMLQNNISPS